MNDLSILRDILIDSKMYPTKSMYEYMSEINRLFPRNTENGSGSGPSMSPESISASFNIPRDFYHTPNPSNIMHSPLQQSTSINRSSSSADSTSSGSFPDMSYRDRLQPRNQTFDTPSTIRRQRPIIGRKIFDSPKNFTPSLEPTPKPFEEELSKSIWNSEDQFLFPNTPPKMEHKNTQKTFYELFPTENKGFEFPTPVTPQYPEPNYSRQTSSIGSPMFSSSTSNMSPTSPKFTIPSLPKQFFPNQPDFASSSRFDIRSNKMCTFCRKNGETPLVYMNHTVKEKIGSQNIVTCPILRSHVCSTCGATGDNAHTITYCPVLRSSNNGLPLQSTTITLKNTRIKSNGRRRY